MIDENCQVVASACRIKPERCPRQNNVLWQEIASRLREAQKVERLRLGRGISLLRNEVA